MGSKDCLIRNLKYQALGSDDGSLELGPARTSQICVWQWMPIGIPNAADAVMWSVALWSPLKAGAAARRRRPRRPHDGNAMDRGAEFVGEPEALDGKCFFTMEASSPGEVRPRRMPMLRPAHFAAAAWAAADTWATAASWDPPPSSPSPRSKGARSLATARHRAACFIAHQWHTDICELLAHTPPRLSRGAWVHGAMAGGVAMGRGVSSARANTGKAKFWITLYDHINASQGAKYCMRNRKSLNV